MVACHQAIREVMLEAGSILVAKEIINCIYARYPDRPWKESTIYAHLYGCSVNNPPAYTQHASFPKFLFDHGNRKYELYDQAKHGKWDKGYRMDKSTEDEVESGGAGMEETPAAAVIGLERDLEEHISRHLDQVESGLRLHPKQGRQFQTEVGRIDILALDRNDNLVVIELKAGTAGYSVVGQVLSYVSCIRQNIAKGKEVRGIIIAHDFDRKLKFASSEVASISLKQYEVDFTFKDVQNDRG